MRFRLVLIVVIGMLTASCGMIDCGAASHNTQAGGACTAHTTFLR